MTIYFTSDQHIGHENIVHNLGAGRPFRNLYHMHTVIRNNWYRTVQPEDIVYVMGDIAMGDFMENILFYENLPGVKKFIPGNHDKIGSLKSVNYNTKFTPVYEQVGFEILPENTDIIIDTSYGPQKVLLSHYPYEEIAHQDGPDRTDKFRKVRPVNEGLPLIHGHTHSTERFNPQQPLQFHIGVDANDYTPVSINSVVEWLESLHVRTLL